LSEIRATTISDAAGTGPVTLTKQSAAKAYFSSSTEGTADKSLNISSGTDNGAGDGTYSFVTSFSDTQYAVLSGNAYRRLEYHDGINTGSIRYITVDPNASQTNLVGYAEDSGLSVGMLGDLA
tara:strand:+ start:2473 stop:2841 length:369 start_codon:yes stop_codon:yes gene_type:complete